MGGPSKKWVEIAAPKHFEPLLCPWGESLAHDPSALAHASSILSGLCEHSRILVGTTLPTLYRSISFD